jgi:hypothetical protein
MAASIPDKYAGFVLSNPTAELAMNNARYIRECTELHLAHRGIEVLWGFERFTNLAVLWVNNNRVRGPRARVCVCVCACVCVCVCVCIG